MFDHGSIVLQLRHITMQINRHGAALVFLVGVIGNLFNIFVLNDRTFHENPCTTYLWWSAVSSVVFIWSGLFTRVLEGYGVLWPNQNQIICKIRLFVLIVCWSMTTYALVGATLDRYLCTCSSVSYRAMSSIRTAKRFLIGVLIITIILFVEIFFCYEGNVPNVPVACYTQSLICQLYNDWMNILYNIVLPSALMAIFGIMTIFNIRRRIIYPLSKLTLAPTINRVNIQPRLRKIDRSLRKILFFQVLALLLLSLPVSIQRFYANLTSNLVKSTHRLAVENLIYSITILLRYIAYSMPFYINIFSGSIFRTVFQRKIRHIFHLNQPSQQQ